jgi:hypothetical protein
MIMGKFSRKLRRSGNPAKRASLREPKAPERSMCLTWIDKDGEPALTGPDHDMECVFLGGTGGTEVCFSCFLANVVSAEVLASGKTRSVRNVPEQYCVLAVPDNQKWAADEAEFPTPNWLLRREDGREVAFWRMGADHEAQHASAAISTYH